MLQPIVSAEFIESLDDVCLADTADRSASPCTPAVLPRLVLPPCGRRPATVCPFLSISDLHLSVCRYLSLSQFRSRSSLLNSRPPPPAAPLGFRPSPPRNNSHRRIHLVNRQRLPSRRHRSLKSASPCSPAVLSRLAPLSCEQRIAASCHPSLSFHLQSPPLSLQISLPLSVHILFSPSRFSPSAASRFSQLSPFATGTTPATFSTVPPPPQFILLLQPKKSNLANFIFFFKFHVIMSGDVKMP